MKFIGNLHQILNIILVEKILKISEKFRIHYYKNLIQYEENLLKFSVNFQENFLEIRKNAI